MRAVVLVVGVVLGVLASSAIVVLAGNPDPPSGPMDAASQMYTLEQIYDRLNDGTVGSKMTSFTEPSSGPGTGTMHTLDDIMAIALAADNPDPPCFDNTNRYVDCANGTVHDTVTGLIWLKKADCFRTVTYATANDLAAELEDGECGLTDGSSPGDWRLPTWEEWEATIARAVALSCTDGSAPSLTNTPGTQCYSAGPQPFPNVPSVRYWSSSAWDTGPVMAYGVGLDIGFVGTLNKTEAYNVWPVRGGQ